MSDTATHPNTLQHTLQHILATHCNAYLLHTSQTLMYVATILGENDVHTLQHTPTRSYTLQHTPTHTKHPAAHTATHCNIFRSHTSKTLMHGAAIRGENEAVCTLQHTAAHSNTLQHTPTHSNALQRTATHCNSLQHTETHSDLTCPGRRCISRRFVARTGFFATHCNTLQHTATHNTLIHIQISHISDANACCGGSWRVQGCL